MDSLSNNMESAKIIANTSALNLHHSYIKPLIPFYFFPILALVTIATYTETFQAEQN